MKKTLIVLGIFVAFFALAVPVQAGLQYVKSIRLAKRFCYQSRGYESRARMVIDLEIYRPYRNGRGHRQNLRREVQSFVSTMRQDGWERLGRNSHTLGGNVVSNAWLVFDREGIPKVTTNFQGRERSIYYNYNEHGMNTYAYYLKVKEKIGKRLDRLGYESEYARCGRVGRRNRHHDDQEFDNLPPGLEVFKDIIEEMMRQY